MSMIGTEYDGEVYSVPETGRNENLNDMLIEIPGQDDTQTPLKLTEQRFYKWAMAFLMQDGNLGVPGGRYGSDTRTCAEVAIIISCIMRYHDGEEITYYKLDHDMGLVVNSADGVAELLREYGPIVFADGFGPLGKDPIDISDYLDVTCPHCGGPDAESCNCMEDEGFDDSDTADAQEDMKRDQR